MTSSQTPVLAAIGAVVLGVSLAAGGGSIDAASSVPVLVAAVSAADPADPVPVDPAAGELATSDLVTGDPAAPRARVSANTASEDVIADALESLGVANPLQVATEIIGSRPIALDDLGLTKLQEQVLKLNPAPQAVDQILSVLLP